MINKGKKVIIKIANAIRNPVKAFNYFNLRLSSYLSPIEFVASRENRSDSENGLYVSAVLNALNSYKDFSVFKRNPLYREILEHVTQEQGSRYLEIIKRDSPWIFDVLDECKENDIIGSPLVYQYAGIGLISPTTLRYMKVASDIVKIFGRNIGDRVVEIGVGYGGQVLINDKIFRIKKYDLIDLPPVLQLASKYLESHLLKCSYGLSTLNQKTIEDDYDLVISNYAFSELPMHLQIIYIEKIISKCKRGYMTMNSGFGKSDRSKNKLSIEQLKSMLPNFSIMNEDPLTDIENYIIYWGN